MWFTHCLHELIAAVVAYTRSTQSQTSQYSCIECKGVQESSPAPEEVRAVSLLFLW